MNAYFRLAAALTAATMAPIYAIGQESSDDEHHAIDEIIVTATPLGRTVEQLAQPTSVVSGDALTRKQAASIGETLANEPGVSASYFGPVASRPVIRGQFGERVRVLSNGLDALDASALSEDHAVSLDSILADSVEIIRGPATLLYGSGAAGGLVNIVDSRIHETSLDDPFSGAISLGSDSATGRRSGAVRFDAGTADAALHLDWFRRDTDDVSIPGFAESARLRALEEAESGEEEEHEDEEHAFGTVENTASETEGGAAAITLTGDESYVGFSFSRYDSLYGIPGHAHEEEHGHEEEGGMEEEEEEESISIDLNQTRYELRGEVGLGYAIDSVRFRVARNDYQHVELEGAEIGTFFDTQATDARIEFRHAPTGRFDGAFGLQYKRIDFAAEGEEAFVPGSETEQLSLFVFEEFALNDRWVLQGSARVEQQKLRSPGLPVYDETAAGASLGAIWSLSDRLRLSANLALTERHPNATELYAEGPHLAVQRFELGSVTLGRGLFDKEMSTNFDLTFGGKFDRIDFSLTGFVNNVDDYILLRPTAAVEDGLQVFEFDQADVEMYGFEAEALVEIFDFDAGHLHASLTSDFVFAEESVSGAYLPRIPPLRLGFGLHYTRDRLDASVNATRYDDQFRIAGGELPTDSYTMLDAELSYRFVDGDVLVFLKGSNLLDEDARRHTSPLKDLVPLPGRSLQAGLRWDF